MKFLKIHMKCYWGSEYIFVNLESLVTLVYDWDVGVIQIHWDKHTLVGYGKIDMSEFNLFLTGDEKVFFMSIREDREEIKRKTSVNIKGE